MARRSEIAVVYLSGLVQGLALVSVPAAASVFTDLDFHGLTSSEYGSLFVPLAIGAILASGTGGPLAKRFGLKPLLLVGLGLNFVSMALLAATNVLTASHALAYGALLVAVAALGLGFGATLAALNTYAAGFFPARSDTALAALHALLGTGTALSPLLAGLVTGGGLWWLAPAGVAGASGLLAAAASMEPLESPVSSPGEGSVLDLLGRASWRLWAYVGFAVLYGISETVLANWAVVFLHQDRGLSARSAGMALAAFWGAVTLGRIVTALVTLRVPAGWIYQALPLGLVAVFLLLPSISGAIAGMVAFALAGFACSALLPLCISFAAQDHPKLSEIVGGGMVAAYMAGFGIGSFGVGPIRDTGLLNLAGIYRASSVLALAMVMVAFLLLRTRPAGVAAKRRATE